MLGGFKDFVSSAWNTVTSFFSSLASWFSSIIQGTKVETKENGVYWTFPDYVSLASHESIGETTDAGDKGRMISRNMQQAGLIRRPMTPTQTNEIENNINNVAAWLGFAFEIGVVIALTKKGLKLASNWTPERLQERYQFFLDRVQNNYKPTGRSTVARDKFIELLHHNTEMMANEIFVKSGKMLNCEKLEMVEYIGMEQGSSVNYKAAHGNVGGADIVVSCGEGGELSYWSTKYMSNARSSISKKSPADVNRLFGGRGARSDEYYDRLTAKIPPEGKADAVLYDLWNTLKTGWAV